MRCRDLLQSWTGPRVVPAPVLVELDHFVPSGAFAGFLEDVRRGAFEIEDLQPRDYDRVGELLASYADLRLGFVDAAVLTVTERFGELRVATLDRRRLGVVRLDHTDGLELLPTDERSGSVGVH